MLPIIHRILLQDLLTPDATQLTREFVIDLARKVCGESSGEVHIFVVAYNDDEAAPIEIATVELNCSPAGVWWLQYVSHPAQSHGLTGSIIPCSEDFAAFVCARSLSEHPLLQIPVCAQTLESEGLGPLASLNLRLANPVPLVPTMCDLVQLMSHAGMVAPRKYRC